MCKCCQELILALVGFLAVGNVDAGADVTCELAIRLVSRNSVVEHPAVSAVMATQSVLNREVCAGIDRRSTSGLAVIAVVRMHAADPAAAKLRFEWPTHKVEPSLVEPGVLPVCIGHPH
jgi:hypothetical protein